MKIARINLRVVLIILVFLVGAPVQRSHAGELLGVRDDIDTLVSFDVSTLTRTDIGSLGVEFSFGGLAYDSLSDVLFMIDGLESLYTVDKASGAATLIGIHGIPSLLGLAFDSKNNILYAGSRIGGFAEKSGNLYSLDLISGSATLIGEAGRPLDGLAYDTKRDQLIGHSLNANGNGEVFLIDRASASTITLFSGDYVNNNGLAYDPENDLFWSGDADTAFYSIDPNDSYTRTLQFLDSVPLDGFAYVGHPIPIPPAILLFLPPVVWTQWQIRSRTIAEPSRRISA